MTVEREIKKTKERLRESYLTVAVGPPVILSSLLLENDNFRIKCL